MIESPNGVVPLLSALAGYIVGVLGEYLRDARARTREREARADSRREKLRARRSDFQREALLSLQDAVMQLARACGRMHHHDEREYKRSGQWGRTLLGEELNRFAYEATVKTLTYTMRVRDDHVRELAKRFRETCSKVGLCGSREEALRAMQESIAALEPLQERLGLVLRKLDDDEDPTG